MSEQPQVRGRDQKWKILSGRERRMITTALDVKVAGRGLTVYRIGRIEQQQRWMWNEVGGRRIGIAVRWGGWAWSLRWRMP